jgi:hypothetical protein
MRSLFRVRTQRYTRRLLSVWLKGCFSFFDKQTIFSFVKIPLFLIALLFEGRFMEVLDQISTLHISAQFWLNALAIWLIINIVWAFIELDRSEKKLGEYTEKGFVYHELYHLKTIQTKVNQESLKVKLSINNAEPKSFVNFRVLVDGAGDRVKIGFGPIKSPLPNSGKYNDYSDKIGHKLSKNKEIAFFAQILPHSSPLTIRIYMASWEIESSLIVTIEDKITRIEAHEPNT